MATVTKRNQPKTFGQAHAPAAGRSATRRRRWWLLAAMLMLGILGWLLPWIVAHSPLLNWIVALATADLKGTASVRSASLGWLSPVVLTEVEVRDAHSEPVAIIPKVTGNRGLAAILCNLSQLGQFRLEQPQLKLTLRDGGSNLEDLLAKYLAPREKPARAIDVALEVADGSISIADAASGQSWTIDKFQLALHVPADKTAPLELQASGTIPDQQRAGRFAAGLQMSWPAPAAIASAGPAQPAQPRAGARDTAGQMSLAAEAVPLAMFQSILGRFLPVTRLSGQLGCTIQGQWNGQAAERTFLRANLTADDLVLGATPLGADQLRLQHLQTVCQLVWPNDQLELQQLAVECELGNASLEGSFRIGAAPPEKLFDLLRQQTYQLSGRIDLARLAQMFPNTLRIQKDTQISSGQLQWVLSSRPGQQGMIWQGRLEADQLKAVQGGRQLDWPQPVLVSFAAHESPQGPVVENLSCQSSFLNVEAAGTPDRLAVSGRFDLGQMVGQLEQLVDLGGLRLAGEGWTHVNWQRTAGQNFEVDAELQVRNFRLAAPGRPAWAEENLVAFFSASGQTDFAVNSRLDTATLHVEVGRDRLDARLSGPVADFRDGGTWPLEARLQGRLEGWQQRLKTWGPLDDWKLAGSCELTAQATASTAGVSVERARLGIEQLCLVGPWLNVNEPNAELVGSGRWDRGGRQVQLSQAALQSGGLSVQANDFVLGLPQQGPFLLAGSVKYQGNLDRVQAWVASPGAPPAWRLRGRFSGQGQLEPSAGVTNAKLDAVIENLAVIDSSGRQFQEPQVRFAVRGGYNPQTQSVQLQQLELSSGTLSGNAAGQLTRSDERSSLDLSATLGYDLEKLSDLLRPWLGDGVRLAGRGTSPVWVRGPLAMTEVQGEAALSWTSAYVCGFRAGPGELKAALSGGMLHVQPLVLEVNQGRVQLAPSVRLAPAPMELSIAPGPVVQQIRIDPAMCAYGLKYAVPALAGVVSAEGSFSVQLDTCRIPLANPARSDLAGRLTVHSVQVEPGPMVRELAVLIGYNAPGRLKQESVIPFQMREGRVYHQGMELVFPELTIRTYGSVGLDQTLAVMAEMPVPPRWLGNTPLGSALRNQTIQLPIGGTLEKPAIDRRALDQVGQRFLDNAARNLLEENVKQQLQHLFGP